MSCFKVLYFGGRVHTVVSSVLGSIYVSLNTSNMNLSKLAPAFLSELVERWKLVPGLMPIFSDVMLHVWED